ncbi:unnamed protein product [Euphydryas editha]|uniref:RING-type E3 ubiquitin transferase n=1 Tax=Euphydryas editha TaxID=104508 RepID=A0AAU9TDJ8_EUPED|nr:unnamed protein product [Euphydryas editha]
MDSQPESSLSDADIKEPPAKVRKLSSQTHNDETDGETCPICLDTWGNSGDHRLVALKCGHLFGVCREMFVHLHTEPIRDVTYSEPREWLLSVGLDRIARIVERGIPSTSINFDLPLWSCSWDYLRCNEFYVGGIGGVIYQYDVRNPSSYIQRLRHDPCGIAVFSKYGLLSCQLNSSWLWVTNMRQLEPRSLPVDGPFISLCYDNESHRALLSCRAISDYEKSSLQLCKLKSIPCGEILFDIEQTFDGSARSSLMSRHSLYKSSFVKAPGASCGAESESSLYFHGLDGATTMSLPQ